MLTSFISLWLYVIPIAALISMALEVFRRNRYSSLNQIAAVCFFVTVIPYMGNFIISFAPASYSRLIVLWVMYFPSFILMSLMLHFCLRLTGRFQKLSKFSIFLLCYGPLVPSVVLLMPFSWISVQLIHVGPWKIDKWSSGLQALTLGTSVYALMICLVLLVAGIQHVKRYDLHLKRKQIRIMFVGYITTYIWGMFFSLINFSHVWGGRINFPDLSMLSMLCFGFFLRYAMVKYDFLPSIDRTYHTLYEVSPVSIIVVNQDGMIIDFNPQAAKLLECQTNDLMFYHIGKFLVEDELADECFFSHTMTGERSIITLTGEVKHVIAESQYLKSQEDLLHYMVWREVRQDVTAEQKARYLVQHDSLTGLANRASFQADLEEHLAHLSSRSLAVILLNIDQFKQIEAALGSGAGDSLLRNMAELLRRTTPASNRIARFGDDNFALIVPEVNNQSEIENIAVDILVACNHWFAFEGKGMPVTISMGVCQSPHHGTHGDELIHYAEMAIYEARKRGPGGFIIYEPALQRAEQHQYLQHLGILKGIEEDEFVLHYQPLIEMETGHIIGVEALIRWIRPGIGFFPPDAFMVAAEDDDSIIGIGYWVLQTVCEQLRRWEQEGLSTLLVSVNLSKKQFLEPNFLTRLKETLQQTGVNPAQLCLEIKEQTALYDKSKAHQLFKQIQSLGVKLSIDDFGTGQASTSLLHDLPFDAVKMEPTFIKEMLSSEKNQTAVHTWITLSHSLGKRVIAKRVEDFEQWELLAKMGCDEIQGYFLSRPLEAHHIIKFMNQKLVGA
ncbi:hypothetical protein BC351_35830 [Paenibacillus ferrarius]|uniref:Diguanylate cyclase n=1 Tax=Paenibacillus ferrarius TaxID=1469647 RepID=A0A1V4HD68_9BACL|nr:EAL domain-containing protein [Paenibacillus ferrarius]OPH50684.1 hypothetical protein BC351_35830 [Paenibacillus ferrarius]